MRCVKVFCALIVLVTASDAARILGIVSTPSYSHQEVFQPIWKELSKRGHQVTTITTDPIADPTLVNLTEIDLRSAYNVWNPIYQRLAHAGFYESLHLIVHLWEEVADYELSHPLIQNLIRNETEKFDVVMVEYSMMSMFAFAKTFNAPLIVITSIDPLCDLRSMVGGFNHPVIYPDPFLPVPDNPTLGYRLLLVFLNLFTEVVKKLYSHPSQQRLIDKHFGTHYPAISELTSDVSLVLTNSEPIFHKPKPLVPTIIEFGGGTHRKALKPLPTELARALDAAENGFIYFSLGSNVKSKDMTEEKRNLILETFAELPYTVLWKFEESNLPNKPSNVITSKWFPQQDLLKHPKLKLFITQGGLQSMDEAVYDHVPMIGMPFVVDQRFNVQKMVDQGFGLSVDYETLNKDSFKATIFEVIGNPKYRNKIKKLAELALDQPMTGLEKAVWWTEYVIRHNGTRHLRSPLLDIPFYQYYLLDVGAVFLLTLIIFFKILAVVCRLIFKLFAPRQKIKKN